jgi:hypothetical protein
MKSFIEVIKEADETQARLKFIQDPKSSSKSIANLTRSEDPVVRNAAEEELKRRRDSGDQDAAAHVQPPKDPSVHTAQTQVGGEQAQAQEKETKTKEVDPNRIAPVKKGSGKDILNNLNKGKTISGDAPNAIELNPQYIIRADGIKEAAMKSVVFSFGRMNPPTVGHEKLVDKIQAVAKANKADARLFLSRTEGDDKNPLPYSDKLKLAKMAFPGIVQDTPKSMYPAGFIGLLKMLEDKYDKVIIVVGSDRLPNIKALANKYTGSEYKFEEIDVVSAGERDPDEEGVSGMSASKMRAAAKAGDLAKFKSGLPSRLKSAAKLVMDKLKQYLSEDLDEAVLTLSQRLKRRTQMRRVKGKIRLGQRRALARKANSKVISRRSKRVAIKMMRKRILRGRKYQDLSYSSRAAVDRQIARRKTAIARLAKRIEPKLRQAEGRRRSGQGFKSISLGPTPIKKKKLREGMSRDNLIQSVNTIMKRIIAEQNYSLAPLEVASLVKKSNETGVPVKVIKEVYARGVASWNMGLREDTTPQQWGFARVNSFLAGGFNAYTADRDLLEQDDVATHDEEKALAKIADTDNKISLGAYADRGSTDKVKAAAAKKLEELGGKEPAQQAAAQPAVAQPAAGEQPQDSGQLAPAVDLNAKSKLTASAAGVITSVIQNNSPNNQEPQPNEQPAKSDKEQQGVVKDKPQSAVDKPTAGAKKTRLSVEEHSKLDAGSKEAMDEIQNLNETIVSKSDKPDVEYVDAIDQLANRRGNLERQLTELVKNKSKAGLEKKARLNEEIKKIKQVELDHRRGQPPKVTTDKIKAGMPRYDRKKTTLVASPEQNQNWEKSGRENHLWSLKNNASGTPDRWPGDDPARFLEGLSNGMASQMLSQRDPPLDLDSPDGVLRAAAFAIRSSLDDKGNVVEGSYLSSLTGENKKISKAAVDNFKQLFLAENAPRINPNKTNAEILSSLDQRQLAQMLVATGMAGAKRDLCNSACDNLGWDRNKVSAVGFAGSKRQIDSAVSALDDEAKRQKEAGIERPYVLTKSGYMLSIDKAKELVYNAGGGDNSSDCTLMVRNDETGEIMFTQTSDKANEDALFGNSTPRKQLESYEDHVDSLQRLGLISEEEHKASKELVEKHSVDLRKAEAEYDNFNISLSSAMLDHANNGKTSDILEVAKKLSDGPNPREYLDAVLKHPHVKDRNDLKEHEKIKLMFEHMKNSFNYPEDDKQNGLAGYTRDQKEFMKRLTNPERWRKYGESSPKIDLKERSRHVENITRAPENFINALNNVIPKHASIIHGTELADRAHISQYIDDGTNPSGDPAASDCFSMIAGSNWIIPEYYKQEILPGIKNMQEFCEKVKTTPTTIVYDKHGNATGGVSAIRGTPGSKVQLDGSTVAYISESENDRDNEFFERRIRTKGGSFASAISWSRKKIKSLVNRNKARGNSLTSRLTGGLVTSTFIDFNDFLTESAVKAVGNQPTVNPKPIHHKASGHKYHIHHMINPNLGMMHQVKHAVDRKDLDIDGDTDEFDKPKAGIPDEIGVGTTPTTKKMFAKYSKELSHIHAGEPVDEQKITPKYTGDENSWYLDASNQKVRVYAQADLKQPEDVGKFLKKPTQQKDIGTIMSMNDFLKTQPEKKK